MTSFYEELHKTEKFSDETENIQSRATIDKWIFRLLLLLIGLMPLIVMAKVEEVISPLISNVELLSSGVKGDLFTHYKALFVLVITIITGTMLLAKILFMGGTIRKTYLNYVLGIFVVAIVVSTIASPNITIALTGQHNRSEGAVSWLCYIALMFIAINIKYPKEVVSYIMYTMIPFVYINLYIITMNFLGKDLLINNTRVQGFVSLFLPEGASISEGSALIGTLNQWNYMSGMFAMMTIMYLAWAVTSKRWVVMFVGIITASVSISIMFMSISTSGFLTVALLFPLILLVIFQLENKKRGLIALSIFLVISAPVFYSLAEKDLRIWNESFGFFIDKNPFLEDSSTIIKNNNVAFASENHFDLPILPNRETAAGSGRVYIWDKTIKLVQDRLFLGYGKDSLVYNFPHYNIDSRAGMWDENTIIDKPHNEFVGILHGFGIAGFCAFIILLSIIVLKTVNLIFTKKWSNFIIAITALAYFAQAMFNDSLPATSAFVFIIMGMLISIGQFENKENTDGRYN
ncbi:O-antigen ligase family protein [Solibacillus sp. FSL W8-0372]|uniref:O-antigen ligase family protein n=1 Tax=Solibacillus sp. FSL W8-0372 TaxID=2921713 RepID=UPI0030D058EA